MLKVFNPLFIVQGRPMRLVRLSLCPSVRRSISRKQKKNEKSNNMCDYSPRRTKQCSQWSQFTVFQFKKSRVRRTPTSYVVSRL